MKKFFTLLLLVCVSLFTGAQVNETIKKKSDENQDKRGGSGGSGGGSSSDDNSSSGSGSDYSSYDYGSYNAGGCAESGECCMAFLNIFKEIHEGNVNYKQEKKKEGIYRVTSTELGFNSGFLPNRYLVSLPRITIVNGIFAYDLRVYYNREERLNYHDDYSTLDLQLLQVNIIAKEYLNIRLGTGMMLESYSGILFNEHTLRVDGYPGQFRITAEGRLAPDYKTHLHIRREFNFSVSHNVLNREKKTKLYASLHGMMARYYDAVNVWSVGVGATVVLGY